MRRDRFGIDHRAELRVLLAARLRRARHEIGVELLASRHDIGILRVGEFEHPLGGFAVFTPVGSEFFAEEGQAVFVVVGED